MVARPALALLLGLSPLACFPAAPTTTTPADPEHSSKPSASSSRRPFIVNWAPTERTALETRAQEGAVVIRWDTSAREAEVLPRCRMVAEPYRFVGSSHASQAMTTKPSWSSARTFRSRVR